MHIDRIIAGMLGVVFPIFAAWSLMKSSAEPATGGEYGVKSLRFGVALRRLWLVTMVLIAVGFSSDLFLNKVRPDDAVQFWFTFVGFALIFGVATCYVLVYRVEYDASWIVVHYPLFKPRKIAWRDVLSVEYVKGSGIVIAVRGEKREVITSLISGAQEFLANAKSQSCEG